MYIYIHTHPCVNKRGIRDIKYANLKTYTSFLFLRSLHTV